MKDAIAFHLDGLREEGLAIPEPHATSASRCRSASPSAGETLLLLSHGVEPAARSRGKRRLDHEAFQKINLHWHDLRHEALSRLADEGVPVHELQLLAGHANITTTQRYMNARANSLAESMRHARERRVNRLARHDEEQAEVG